MSPESSACRPLNRNTSSRPSATDININLPSFPAISSTGFFDSMSINAPRHVICVPGGWRSFDEVSTTVAVFGGSGFELDREYSSLHPDPRMVPSFRAAFDRVHPTMHERDWEAIRNHSSVAYVLSPPILSEEAVAISAQTLQLTGALLKNGGVAAKAESSGIAHGREHWLELATRCLQSSTGHAQRAALYYALVRRPILDDKTGSVYSCGMHLLGKPDIEMESTRDELVAVQWIDLLGLYLIADQPQRLLTDGDGFRLHDSGPRRIIRLLPCTRYEKDEFFFNPYGMIRLEPQP
ncbi:MAG: hypothetical protein JSS02_32880 [Planctomycetes bacterium]|nr:hypothetical protein [Planctomycetota bacterium]